MLSAIFLFAQTSQKLLGMISKFTTEQLTTLIAILGFLVLTGVIRSPTTKGIGDSTKL
ncbi:phage holin [Staphylococcus aureus]